MMIQTSQSSNTARLAHTHAHTHTRTHAWWRCTAMMIQTSQSSTTARLAHTHAHTHARWLGGGVQLWCDTDEPVLKHSTVSAHARTHARMHACTVEVYSYDETDQPAASPQTQSEYTKWRMQYLSQTQGGEYEYIFANTFVSPMLNYGSSIIAKIKTTAEI